VTVILSTHVLPEVESLCDRVIVIDKGKILAADTLAVLSGSMSSIQLRVARPDAAFVAELAALDAVDDVVDQGDGRFTVGASRDVREAIAGLAVSRGLLELGARRGLEDVYLQLTGGGR
jgi:ABC-2 type transport system ATP-binding protein